MVSATVEAIALNAARSLNDAKLLYQNERYESATALCVLSLEEAGKACLIRWKEESLLKDDLGAYLNAHISKQRTLYCFLYAKETLLALAAYYSDESRAPTLKRARGEFTNDGDFGRYVWRSFLQPADDSDLVEFCAKRVWEKTHKEALYAETGTLNLLKQLGIYKDIDDLMQVTLPAGVPCRACAEQLLDLAETAMKMPRASAAIHVVMATIYLRGPVFGTPQKFSAGRSASINALKVCAAERSAETTKIMEQ